MIIQRTILLLILAVELALPAVLPSSPQSVNPSKEIKVLATGPKVSIKSLALNTPNSKRRMTGGGGGSQLHEIFLTPYRYVEKEMRAVVNLIPSGHEGKQRVEGIIYLKQETPEGGLTLKGNISGLNPGQKHGIHVHELGDIRDGCRPDRIGPHYNPYSFNHGAPNFRHRHAGDLGNIKADANGRAVFTLSDKLLSLVGARNIIGRSIVIDWAEDEGLLELPGQVGNPAACGVVGRV